MVTAGTRPESLGDRQPAALAGVLAAFIVIAATAAAIAIILAIAGAGTTPSLPSALTTGVVSPLAP
jgi:hypothetical protein